MTESIYRQELEYWLEKQQECERILKLISQKDEASESIIKMKGKLEAYQEIVARCQQKLSS
jgi:hypothetical protein